MATKIQSTSKSRGRNLPYSFCCSCASRWCSWCPLQCECTVSDKTSKLKIGHSCLVSRERTQLAAGRTWWPHKPTLSSYNVTHQTPRNISKQLPLLTLYASFLHISQASGRLLLLCAYFTDLNGLSVIHSIANKPTTQKSTVLNILLKLTNCET